MYLHSTYHGSGGLKLKFLRKLKLRSVGLGVVFALLDLLQEVLVVQDGGDGVHAHAVFLLKGRKGGIRKKGRRREGYPSWRSSHYYEKNRSRGGGKEGWRDRGQERTRKVIDGTDEKKKWKERTEGRELGRKAGKAGREEDRKAGTMASGKPQGLMVVRPSSSLPNRMGMGWDRYGMGGKRVKV
jgi:hypothetical protein